jgi:hypothetical protein
MCWFFKRKEKKAAPAAEKHDRSRADEIRKYVRTAYITPARKKGLAHVSFSSEEVQAAISAEFKHGGSKTEWQQGVRLQSIVSAVDAKKFPEFARAKLTKRTEKKGGGVVRWTFEI